MDLVLQISWENAGPGGRHPTFPSWVCSACPQLGLMPPFKLVLQSVVLLTTCESVCASPRPAALWHPLPTTHRWAGRGLVPRAGAGRTSTCERAARGQMAPGSRRPLHSPSGPRAVAHAEHTSTHHALYTAHDKHATHTTHSTLYNTAHAAHMTRHAPNTHYDSTHHTHATHVRRNPRTRIAPHVVSWVELFSSTSRLH